MSFISSNCSILGRWLGPSAARRWNKPCASTLLGSSIIAATRRTIGSTSTTSGTRIRAELACNMPLISKRSGTDRRAELLPAELLPLFGDDFVGSWDLLGEYVARLACTILRTTGLDRELDQETTVSDAIARAGLDASVAAVPTRWLVEILAGRGWMAKVAAGGGETAYRLPKPLPALDAAQVEVAQEQHDASCLPSYTIAAMAAEQYPAVLRGETTGEQALFGPEGISAWVKYFSNANPLYAISNRVGAIAVEQANRNGGAILELGGGL